MIAESVGFDLFFLVHVLAAVATITVIVGLLCYLAIAGHLEARTLPLERTVAEEIAKDGVADAAKGRQLARSVDVIGALLAVALISMIIQF